VVIVSAGNDDVYEFVMSVAARNPEVREIAERLRPVLLVSGDFGSGDALEEGQR